MLERFLEFIEKENLFTPKDKVLLTVSGGADSIVMAELFHKAGFKFAIAHCNFHLRGEESDYDEAFVRNFAETHKVSFHLMHFQTIEYSKENEMSIEMAARELRYKWFYELAEAEKYRLIATAHHLDDEAETFFINLLRGTGISGLHGIASISSLQSLDTNIQLIRPMLFLYKQDIVDYCNTNNIAYHEDSSNVSLQYLRNKIRHKILPELKEINPSFHKNLKETIDNLKDTETINNYFINKKRAKIISERNDKIYISISKLKKLTPIKAYLFEFLSPYGFNSSVINDIFKSLDSIPGKQFLSPTHKLIKDRAFLIITKSDTKNETQFIRHKNTITDIPEEVTLIKQNTSEFQVQNLNLNIQYLKLPKSDSDQLISKEKNIATIDMANLKFPLTLRKWKQGDYFYPYGLNKKKKVSRFLIDEKISMTEKENIYVICSGEAIIWVVGLRIDDRFKITNKTKDIIKISV